MPSFWCPVVVSPSVGKDASILKWFIHPLGHCLCSHSDPWRCHDGVCFSRRLHPWKMMMGPVFSFAPPGPLKYHWLQASLRTQLPSKVWGGTVLGAHLQGVRSKESWQGKEWVLKWRCLRGCAASGTWESLGETGRGAWRGVWERGGTQVPLWEVYLSVSDKDL